MERKNKLMKEIQNQSFKEILNLEAKLTVVESEVFEATSESRKRAVELQKVGPNSGGTWMHPGSFWMKRVGSQALWVVSAAQKQVMEVLWCRGAHAEAAQRPVRGVRNGTPGRVVIIVVDSATPERWSVAASSGQCDGAAEIRGEHKRASLLAFSAATQRHRKRKKDRDRCRYQWRRREGRSACSETVENFVSRHWLDIQILDSSPTPSAK